MQAEKPIMKAMLACVIGWVVPGAGHFFLGRWGKGFLLCFSVLLMFVLGLQMDGKLVSFKVEPESPDFFATAFAYLTLIAEAAVGLPYFIAVQAGYGVGNVKSFTYDYGNKFLYVAGLLNMLIILDAYDIAMGKKG